MSERWDSSALAPAWCTYCSERSGMKPDGPSVATLESILAAFNNHDLDGVRRFFSEKCVLEMPRGPDPWGTRYLGFAAVKEGLRSRFAGIPDVRYDDDTHLVC